MDSFFGDPSLSSTQLRLKAYNIIRQSDRPMASSEIEKWIRVNDYDLWVKVSSKCKDYVRVILSQTRGKTIAKFRALKPVSGIDKRATFYGIYGRNYPSDMWISASESAKGRSHKRNEYSNEDEKPYIPSKDDSSNYSDDSMDSYPVVTPPSHIEMPQPLQNKVRIELPHLPPIGMLGGQNPILPSLIVSAPVLYNPSYSPIELLLN